MYMVAGMYMYGGIFTSVISNQECDITPGIKCNTGLHFGFTRVQTRNKMQHLVAFWFHSSSNQE